MEGLDHTVPLRVLFVKSGLRLQFEGDRTGGIVCFYLKCGHVTMHFNVAREFRACRGHLQTSNPFCMLDIVGAATLKREVETVMVIHFVLLPFVREHSSVARDPSLPGAGGQGSGS